MDRTRHFAILLTGWPLSALIDAPHERGPAFFQEVSALD